MKVRGMGGYWVVPFNPDDYYIGSYVVHNAEYEVSTEVDVREYRSTGCGGWTEGLPRFRRVEYARFRVAEDDVSYPQVLGFTEGAELTVLIKRGALNQFDKLEATIVKNVRVHNDQRKARWVEVTCVHGRYFRGIPTPAVVAPDAGELGSLETGSGGEGFPDDVFNDNFGEEP